MVQKSAQKKGMANKKYYLYERKAMILSIIAITMKRAQSHKFLPAFSPSLYIIAAPLSHSPLSYVHGEKKI